MLDKASTPKEITWTEETYDPRSLWTAYDGKLPLIAKVTKGNQGENHIDCVNEGQVCMGMLRVQISCSHIETKNNM